MNDPVEVGIAEPIWETDDALKVNLDGVGEMWVPKWAIHDDSEVWKMGQKPGELVVKGKFADDQGWR